MSRITVCMFSGLMFSGLMFSGLMFSGCGEQSVEFFDGAAPRDGSVDISLRDPTLCGALEIHCEDDEYCIGGACECRPPLSLIGEDCVDTNADAEHCGGADRSCALCVDGVCGSVCSAGTQECEGACVDMANHPLHCGECGRPCGSDQICVSGQCEEFTPAPCTSCPCGCARACCAYPTRATDTICLEADACP